MMLARHRRIQRSGSRQCSAWAPRSPLTPGESPMNCSRGSPTNSADYSGVNMNRSDGRPAAHTPDILPRPDYHFDGEIGRTYKDSDPPRFPQPVQAPKGAPNIVLILLDDVGFGQFSTFGGGVPSPTMDRLAKEGLRYNHFHTT